MKIRLFAFLALVSLPLFGIGCVNLTLNPVKDGGFFRSLDFGETWEQKVFVRLEKKKTITISEVNPLSITFDPASASTIYLGTEANGIIVSTDGGETWNQTTITTGNAKAISIDPEIPSTVYVAYGAEIWKTVDGMVSWERVYLEPRGVVITDVQIDLANVSRVLATTASGDVIESGDFGENWATVHSVKDKIIELHMSTLNPRIFYLRTEKSGLMKTTDGGATLTVLKDQFAAFPGSLTMNDLYFTPQHPDILYLATHYGILVSRDGGGAWSALETLFPLGSLPIKTVRVDPRDEGIMYFPVGPVLHKTTDGGQTWKTIETLPSNRPLQKIEFHPDDSSILYASVYITKK